MNYEQKYEEALKRARHYHDRDNIHFLEQIFPELRESEDEKIRKGITKSIMDLNTDWLKRHGVTRENALAWLEKQGEKSEYNPYKATVESIAEMCKSYSTSTDLHDFYDNIRVKCKNAIEYDKTWNEKQDKQPSWSEKDNIRLDHLIGFIQKYGLEYYASIDKVIDFIDWLKSLKPQNRWRPSGKQMDALDKAKNSPANYYDVRVGLQSLYNDLKNL